jgi:hypothetical protein
MGVSGQHHALAARGKEPPVPIVQEAGWAPEPVWTQRLEEKSFAPAGNRTPITRSSSLLSDTILTELPGSHPKPKARQCNQCAGNIALDLTTCLITKGK